MSTADSVEILSVSALNASARLLLETAYRLVWIEGEVSNLRIPASGHWYFTLKDANAQVRCVLFRGRQRFVRTAPKDGLQVRVQGAVSLYEERGEFQILCERMEASGDGAARRALERLRQQLGAEGLFAEARKRVLPSAPAHLVLITSATGAAAQDVLKVLRERCPLLRVTLLPVAVQGDAAAPAIRAALAAVAELPIAFALPPVDVVILGRGGGSAEDLQAFNDEGVVRAVAACAAPVIAAVGHETDVSLTDFVADARAPTPSAAAALAVPELNIFRRGFAEHAQALALSAVRGLERHRLQLQALRARLRDPGRRLDDFAQMLDERDQRLRLALRRRLAHAGEQLQATALRLRAPAHLLQTALSRVAALDERLRTTAGRRYDAHAQQLAAQRTRIALAVQHAIGTRRHALALEARALAAVSPLATLERGYAVLHVGRSDPRVIVSAHAVQPGDLVRTRLRDGSVLSTVLETDVVPP